MTAIMNKYQHLLSEFCPTVFERAREATAAATRTAGEDPFAAGRCLGYYEVVSTLTQLMETTGVTFGEVYAQPIDPDRELIRTPSARKE